MDFDDTILALSSPPPAGGGDGIRAILRLSGPHAPHLAALLTTLPRDATPGHHKIQLNELPTLPASALVFHAPRSFTGEHVVELHIPNSPALIRHVLDQLLAAARDHNLPARPANPGEFSARAFFHNKIDLTEAEGIAATINAANESQLRAASSLRSGDLHKAIERYVNEIAHWLALVEAGIDFSDEEDVQAFDSDELLDSLLQLEHGLAYLIQRSVRADRLGVPPSVVFVGKPNVGKSSLINALAGTDRSIVSPIAGTTRDILSVVMHTPAGDIRLTDVAGEEPAVDELRMKMMDARQAALMEADLIVQVLADDRTVLSGLRILGEYPAYAVTVQNKIDLLPPDQIKTAEYLPESNEFMTLRGEWQMVSAKTGQNIGLLKDEIVKLVLRRQNRLIGPQMPAVNSRHRQLLEEARIAVRQAYGHFEERDDKILFPHPELLAAELRRALDLLGQITGAISPDDVLGRIFSTFCIGK